MHWHTYVEHPSFSFPSKDVVVGLLIGYGDDRGWHSPTPLPWLPPLLATTATLTLLTALLATLASIAIIGIATRATIAAIATTVASYPC